LLCGAYAALLISLFILYGYTVLYSAKSGKQLLKRALLCRAVYKPSNSLFYKRKLKNLFFEPLDFCKLRTVSEFKMSKKPDMVMVVITLFVVSILASSMAQSALM
jgi:hypothetical protein